MKKHVIIIAEAGVNHNGSLEMALQLVRTAKEAGADYVKFQTFNADSLVSATAVKAEYQKANCGDGDDSQLAMLRRLELSFDDFKAISAECRRVGIGFMSTPFDAGSVEILSDIGQDFWKIPSGEITNLPLLRQIGALKSRVILSTGMSTLEEVESAVRVLEKAGTPRKDIILLHCTTQYPAPFSSVNLSAMNELRQLGCGGTGYSDHTEGIAVSIAAAAIGADVVEKHFTLDRSLPGPDHRASLEPSELAMMVRDIRRVEEALGDGKKGVAGAERDNISVARKSIVALRRIARGEVFSSENITCKRPGTGLSPMLWDEVVGKTARRDFDPDELIEL